MSKKKITSDRLATLRNKLCDIWGNILIKPIPTQEVFEKLGFIYNNTSHRENLYKYNRTWQEEAEAEWEKFEIIGGNKEVIFKKWLDHCYLNKKPYILFVNKMALSPRTYKEWERILSLTCIRKLYGTRKALIRMGVKSMELRYNITDLHGNQIENQISIKRLVSRHDKTLKLLENETKQKDLDKLTPEELDQLAHKIEKKRMEIAKKQLKDKVENNNNNK